MGFVGSLAGRSAPWQVDGWVGCGGWGQFTIAFAGVGTCPAAGQIIALHPEPAEQNVLITTGANADGFLFAMWTNPSHGISLFLVVILPKFLGVRKRYFLTL